MSERYDVPYLSRLFDEGVKKGATHMFVMFQRTGETNGVFDYDDRHYYVMSDHDVRAEIAKHKGELMEVYDLRKSKENQLLAFRAMNV